MVQCGPTPKPGEAIWEMSDCPCHFSMRGYAMSEKRLIGVCGIVCSECGAYLATMNNDESLRKKTAEEWSKMFGADIKPESIYCVGCITPKGKHFSHCSECEIRACGLKKKATNCGHCPDYPCETISGFFKMVPAAKAVLDAEHKTVY